MRLVDRFDGLGLINCNRPAPLYSFISEIAARLDELNKRLAKTRAAKPDAVALKPDYAGSWSYSIGSANGPGDIQIKLREMAENIDLCQEWLAELGIMKAATVPVQHKVERLPRAVAGSNGTADTIGQLRELCRMLDEIGGLVDSYDPEPPKAA